MRKSDGLLYALSKRMIISLFIYYFILIVIGALTVIRNICNIYTTDNNSTTNWIKISFVCSISISLALCSVQYTKRLYKACITKRIISTTQKEEYIGNMAYFLFRPLFSIVFVVVMIVCLLSGMYTVTGVLDYILNDKFIYLSMIISSFIGYSIGNLMDNFQKISDKKITSLTEEVKSNV